MGLRLAGRFVLGKSSVEIVAAGEVRAIASFGILRQAHLSAFDLIDAGGGRGRVLTDGAGSRTDFFQTREGLVIDGNFAVGKSAINQPSVLQIQRSEINVIEVVFLGQFAIETERFLTLGAKHAIHLEAGLVLEILNCHRGRGAKGAIDGYVVAITVIREPVVQGFLNQLDLFGVPLEISRETRGRDALSSVNHLRSGEEVARGSIVQTVELGGEGVNEIVGQVGQFEE